MRSSLENTNDYVEPSPRRSPPTMPLPTVSRVDLRPSRSVEDHLPALVVAGFVLLAGIQFALR